MRIVPLPSSAAVLLAALLATALAGCVAPPPPRHPPYRERVAPPPEPVTEVIAYPAQGQSEQQLDRDRYECNQWAVRQTGFDPSVPGVPPREQVRVVRAPEPPPGAAVAGGAVTGAVLGAIVAPHGDEAGGAAVGAIAGAVVGAAAGSARAEERRRDDEAAAARPVARSPRGEQAGAYRRAISACLAGRGYSVR